MKIDVNFAKVTGKIKPMHAVGQPPFTGGFAKLDFTPMQILKDAHIPYSRLHDVGGPFGSNRYVDIPNIFRNFDADVNDPASYDFTFTDELLKGLESYGVKPYFRLGVTIENQCQIKAYHIHPPKDYDKWARICEHIIMHYNEGWADGFHYGIEYWEIWNEPENDMYGSNKNQMWTGTPLQYYELYDVAAKHLKKCFGDKIKIGGYSASGLYGLFVNPQKYGLKMKAREGTSWDSPKQEYRIKFFTDFLDYIKEHGSPIDYFSWHIYGDTEMVEGEADYIVNTLEEKGFGGLETHCTEWNLSHNRVINRNRTNAHAHVMATMISLQHKKTDMLMYYDAKYMAPNTYGGFYDLVTYAPSAIYYSFKAFGVLYGLENEVECNCPKDGIYALAAENDGKKAIVITNVSEDTNVELDLTDEFSVYIIDENNLFEKTDMNPKDFMLKENTVAVIMNF